MSLKDGGCSLIKKKQMERNEKTEYIVIMRMVRAKERNKLSLISFPLSPGQETRDGSCDDLR